ncbi:uncharacterized protein LOC124776359 [Schistocerca piceifrons]|uniref:uncharacterized protein LOC124776359 n=1 Tax=Schistocerca piceifrons TaxID=274613 RepID=UPI001F5F0026|nr:uncharacterized protein LOC124776359 [Schistocerca piceifrons]
MTKFWKVLECFQQSVSTNNEDIMNNQSCKSSVELQHVQSTRSTCIIPPFNKNADFKWVEDKSEPITAVYPPANYQDCLGMPPNEQFEKFFHDAILQNICDESEKYARFLEKPNPNNTLEELKVFIGILLVTDYNYHPCVRSFWGNDGDLKNEMVSNAMQRNSFQQILQFLHFEGSRKKRK